MYELGDGQGFLVGYSSEGKCLIENTIDRISDFIMDSKIEEEVILKNSQIEITVSPGFILKPYSYRFIKITNPQMLGEMEPVGFVHSMRIL